MELIQTIALLCQITITSDGGGMYRVTDTLEKQLRCQQSYLNCVLKRSTWTQTRALEQCILEK